MRSKALQGPDPADDAVALGIELQIQLNWYAMKVGPSVNIEELLVKPQLVRQDHARLVVHLTRVLA